MKLKIYILLLAFVAGAFSAKAQDVALKTNLLYDATLTANLGAEMQVAPHWSVDLSANLNAWSLDGGKKWKHWLVQPEARYWFCQPLGGHFLAAHLIGGQFNVGHIGHLHKFLGTHFSNLSDHRYQGWGVGAGIGYGYSWLLGKHWNLEAEIALGWIYTRYDVFECAGCGRRQDTGRVHNYVGPTKAALNLVYVF